MLEVIGGAVLLLAGVGLLASSSFKLGLILMPAGAVLLVRGAGRWRRAASVRSNVAGLGDLAAEINRQIAQGATPDQIAAGFDREHGIAPVHTLQLLAADRLALIGRLEEQGDMVAVLDWVASGAPAEPIAPSEAVSRLNRRTTLFGAAPEVLLQPSDDATPPVRGTLVAARSHLLFLVDPAYESPVAAFLKGVIPLPIPQVLEIVKTGGEMAKALEAEAREELTPEALADLARRLGLPGSCAIPWRHIQAVGKEAVEGPGPPRTRLVVTFGEEAGLSESVRLMAGTGLDEVWVDDWVALIKVVGLLDGALLLTDE